MEDYELLTLMLSALAWRRHNGEIRMVTDSVSAMTDTYARDLYRELNGMPFA